MLSLSYAFVYTVTVFDNFVDLVEEYQQKAKIYRHCIHKRPFHVVALGQQTTYDTKFSSLQAFTIENIKMYLIEYNDVSL